LIGINPIGPTRRRSVTGQAQAAGPGRCFRAPLRWRAGGRPRSSRRGGGEAIETVVLVRSVPLRCCATRRAADGVEALRELAIGLERRGFQLARVARLPSRPPMRRLRRAVRARTRSRGSRSGARAAIVAKTPIAGRSSAIRGGRATLRRSSRGTSGERPRTTPGNPTLFSTMCVPRRLGIDSLSICRRRLRAESRSGRGARAGPARHRRQLNPEGGDRVVAVPIGGVDRGEERRLEGRFFAKRTLRCDALRAR
jgi:hypothetical protein